MSFMEGRVSRKPRIFSEIEVAVLPGGWTLPAKACFRRPMSEFDPTNVEIVNIIDIRKDGTLWVERAIEGTKLLPIDVDWLFSLTIAHGPSANRVDETVTCGRCFVQIKADHITHHNYWHENPGTF